MAFLLCADKFEEWNRTHRGKQLIVISIIHENTHEVKRYYFMCKMKSIHYSRKGIFAVEWVKRVLKKRFWILIYNPGVMIYDIIVLQDPVYGSFPGKLFKGGGSVESDTLRSEPFRIHHGGGTGLSGL